MPKQKARRKSKAPVKGAGAKTSPEEKVIGFGAGTQAARMYALLADGKARSVAEIHKVISDTTESHVGNGLLYALRKRGYETGQFHIIMTEDHKLRLVKGPKPAKAKVSSKAHSASRMETGAGAEA